MGKFLTNKWSMIDVLGTIHTARFGHKTEAYKSVPKMKKVWKRKANKGGVLKSSEEPHVTTNPEGQSLPVAQLDNNVATVGK